jgi:hypothetical protein
MTQTTLFTCGRKYRVRFIASDDTNTMIYVKARDELHAKALARAERGPAGGIKWFLSVDKWDEWQN